MPKLTIKDNQNKNVEFVPLDIKQYLNLLTSNKKLKSIIISKNNKNKAIHKIKTEKNNFQKKNVNNNLYNIQKQKRNITPEILNTKKKKLINNIIDKNNINNNKETYKINTLKGKLNVIDKNKTNRKLIEKNIKFK